MHSDLAAIRKALESLPAQCRYHHDRTESSGGWFGREACCDTGVPAQRRKLAEQALQRLAGQSTEPGFVEQFANPRLIGSETKGPDLH